MFRPMSKNPDVVRRIEKYHSEPITNLHKKLQKHSNRAKEAWEKYTISRALMDGIQDILGVPGDQHQPIEEVVEVGARELPGGRPLRHPQAFSRLTFDEVDTILEGCRKADLKKVILGLANQTLLTTSELSEFVAKVQKRPLTSAASGALRWASNTGSSEQRTSESSHVTATSNRTSRLGETATVETDPQNASSVLPNCSTVVAGPVDAHLEEDNLVTEKMCKEHGASAVVSMSPDPVTESMTSSSNLSTPPKSCLSSISIDEPSIRIASEPLALEDPCNWASSKPIVATSSSETRRGDSCAWPEQAPRQYIDRLVRVSELQAHFVRFCDDSHHLSPEGARRFFAAVQQQSHDAHPDVERYIELLAAMRQHEQAQQGQLSHSNAKLRHHRPRFYRRRYTERGVSIRRVLKLLSDPILNPVFRPTHRKVYQDMTLPISAYFIASSHNTYLDGPQFGGKSCTAAIRRALEAGVRMVELDCHDGPGSSATDSSRGSGGGRVSGRSIEPVVRHGNSKSEASIPFSVALREIRRSAFLASTYPLILTLENHCSLRQQAVQVRMLQEHIGDLLALPKGSVASSKGLEPVSALHSGVPGPSSGNTVPFVGRGFDSPHNLKGKILLRLKLPYKELHKRTVWVAPNGANTSGSSTNVPECDSVRPSTQSPPSDAIDRNSKKHSVGSSKEMSNAKKRKTDVVVLPELEALCYMQNFRTKRKDMSILAQRWHRHPSSAGIAVSTSWDEIKLGKAVKEFSKDLVRFCQRHVMRVYPAFFRFDSSNFDPQKAWGVGVQCVALNLQTSRAFLALHRAKFADNGGCGYVLKPRWMRESSNQWQASNVLPSAKYTRSLVIDIIGLDFHGHVVRTTGSPRAVAQKGSGSVRAASQLNNVHSDVEWGFNQSTSDGSPALAKGGNSSSMLSTPSRLFLSMEMATKSSAKFSSVVEFRKGPSDAWEPLQSQASGTGKSGTKSNGRGTKLKHLLSGQGQNQRLKVLLENAAPVPSMGLEGGGRAVSAQCEFPLASADCGIEILNLRLTSEPPSSWLSASRSAIAEFSIAVANINPGYRAVPLHSFRDHRARQQREIALDDQDEGRVLEAEVPGTFEMQAENDGQVLHTESKPTTERSSMSQKNDPNPAVGVLQAAPPALVGSLFCRFKVEMVAWDHKGRTKMHGTYIPGRALQETETEYTGQDTDDEEDEDEDEDDDGEEKIGEVEKNTRSIRSRSRSRSFEHDTVSQEKSDAKQAYE